jgi:hypothetical protein
MAKTRRTKINSRPPHPFGGRAARPKVYVVEQGEQITTTGFRGRTVVTRILGEDGKRTATVRVAENVIQTPAKAVGDRKPKAIFVRRQYTGVARGKSYPYRSVKRGGQPTLPDGLMELAKKAIKKVVVGEAAE